MGIALAITNIGIVTRRQVCEVFFEPSSRSLLVPLIPQLAYTERS